MAGITSGFLFIEMRKPQLIRRARQGWNGQPYINTGYVMIPRFETYIRGGKPGDELYAVENDKKMKECIDLSDIEEITRQDQEALCGGAIRL
jgi:hypothetical protein